MILKIAIISLQGINPLDSALKNVVYREVGSDFLNIT
jgi:hypothetical protein